MNIAPIIESKYGSKSGLINLCKHQLTWRMSSIIEYPEPQKISRLVFVCQGNICRSAIAEAIATKLGLNATSFGLDAGGGDPADQRMISLGSENGYDLSGHRTRRVESFVANDGDFYLAMDLTQCKSVSERFGENVPVSLLGLWSSPARVYIHDPYSCSEAYFSNCFNLILTAVTNLEKKLGTSCRSQVQESAPQY